MNNRGQGIVEYALIIVLIAVVVIVVISIFGSIKSDVCIKPNTQECKSYLIEQCVKDEEFTREECIILWSGVQK